MPVLYGRTTTCIAFCLLISYLDALSVYLRAHPLNCIRREVVFHWAALQIPQQSFAKFYDDSIHICYFRLSNDTHKIHLTS